jgi:hypothetical protein
MVFFNRGGRRPEWMNPTEDAMGTPVVIESRPRVAELLCACRSFYNDVVRDELAAIVGFTVNLPWPGRTTFQKSPSRLHASRARGGAPFLVLDDRGMRVAGSVAPSGSPTIRRSFSLLFLDPLVGAADPPGDLPVHERGIQMAVESDTALATAIRIANRSLAVAAFATAMLTVGLILSVRAAGASAELSTMRSEFVSTVAHEIKTPMPVFAPSATRLCPVARPVRCSSNARTCSCRNQKV